MQGILKKEASLNKKEKVFCVYISNGKSPDEAALLSGFENGKDGFLLMAKNSVVKEVERLIDLRLKLSESLAAAGFQRIAFGSITDCVRLISGVEDSSNSLKEISDMDLFMISEIKKPKDGAMEIKFYDRIKALEKLQESVNSTEKSLPFYEALEKGAMALGNANE